MKRFVIVLGSLLGTGLLVGVAFLLGAAGFDARRYGQHEVRLQKLLPQKPTLEQMVKGLEGEGTRLLASPATLEDVKRQAATRGGHKQAEILEKARAHPGVRVFLASDMVYFLYFDRDGILKDFTCVSR